MTYVMPPPLPSPVLAVIFDWAGTLVDHGSLAPTQIFVDAFQTFGITVTLDQARGPMGLSKRVHIRQLLRDPGVRAQWQTTFDRSPTEADIDAIYERFMPMQIEKVGAYSQPIPGAVETLAWLRARGIKIGSCSGYPKQVLDVLRPLAKQAGIAPDHAVAGDELPAGGRPGAYMALANLLALQVPNVRACVKVDDTVPGVEEGRNAGMWSVGLALSGNEMGYSLADAQALKAAQPAEYEARLAQARRRLQDAGANYVIDSVAELPAVIEAIEVRLKRGEHP